MSFNLTPSAITAGSLETWEFLASYGDLRNWALLDGVLNATDSANSAWNYNTYHVTSGRSITFDAWGYLASNNDLISWLTADGLTDADAEAAAKHYIKYGINEGRSITFDADAYKAANPDLAGLTWAQAAQHYITAGRYEILAGVTGRSAVGTPLAYGTTTTLTGGADTVPGTGGADYIIGTDLTLSAGDRIHGSTGIDTLKVSSSAPHSFSAFEMDGVENIQVTADAGNPLTFDLSGTTGLSSVITTNSTGDVAFNFITTVPTAAFVVEVNNLTLGANASVDFTNSKVAGTSDVVSVQLNNSTDAQIGTLSIDTGVETVALSTSGAPSAITTELLMQAAGTLNIAGSQKLTIQDINLGVGANVINASTLNADLTVTHALTGVTSYTGAKGADSVDFTGSTKNMTIVTGDGKDVVTLGLTDDNVDTGNNDDTIYIVPQGLTVNDTINGGAGADTIILTGSDNISKSEAEKVTAVEKLELRGSGANYNGAGNYFTADLGSNIVIADHLLTTLSAGSDRFSVDTTKYSGSNTIDLTNVTFSNTNKFELDASATGSNNELVIANDATVNAKAILNFGAGSADTLRVMDSANITADDLSNIDGMERIELRSNSGVDPQVWDIELTNALVDNSTSDALDIWIDNDVPSGTIVNINAAALTKTGITVHTNSHVTLNVTGAGAANVSRVNSLYFTLSGDALIGTAGADTFIADNLAQVQNGDSAIGLGGNDTLSLNFNVYNAAVNLLGAGGLLNNVTLDSIENVVFNANRLTATDHPVAFIDNANSTTGIISYTTGDGNDIVYHNILNRAVTYNLGNGDNIYYDWLGNDATDSDVNDYSVVNAGSGKDKVYTDNDQSRGGALDHVHGVNNEGGFFLGTGTDTLFINGRLNSTVGDIVEHGSNYNLSGVDVVDFTSFISWDSTTTGVTVLDGAVSQTDSKTLLTVNAHDNVDAGEGAGAVNSVAIVNASDVLVGHNLAITVDTLSSSNGRLADAVDVISGAGIDTITIGAGLVGYVVAGNAGADTIHINTTSATGVQFNSPNDGGTTGAYTGYDTITGFNSGNDYILFNHAAFNSTLGLPTAADANLVLAVNQAVDFAPTAALGAHVDANALIMTHLNTYLNDSDAAGGILNLVSVADRASTIGVAANVSNGGIIVAQGVAHSAIYLYIEQTGNGFVEAAELKLLGVVDSNSLGNAAHDLHYTV
jgi:hypothetical protein